jgi:chromate reductase
MTLNVLAVPGSLRQESINRRLLTALGGRSPAGVRFTVFDGLQDVPLFCEDLEIPSAPIGVRRWCRATSDADVLVIATPEYNQSLPGVVKNAIDWLSRDPAGCPLVGKPCAVTGSTVGSWGTRIAQQQLKTVLMICGAKVLSSPVLYHPGGLTADPSEQAIDDFWNGLISESQPLQRAA